MIQKFFKYLILILVAFSISLANADDHKPSKELINDLKEEIREFDAKPEKRKLIQSSKKYIEVLENQLDDLFWSTPAVSNGNLLLRGSNKLYCIREIRGNNDK